jgi:hypothetical protein
MTPMAVAAKKLSIGDLVEIEGRRYDVVSDKAGGVEFDELFGDLPRDGEG